MLIYKIITSLRRPHKQVIFTAIDAVVVACAFFLTVFLISDSPTIQRTLSDNWMPAVTLSLIGVCVAWFFGLPRIKLNAYETRGIVRTALYAASLTLIAAVMNALLGQGFQSGLFSVFALWTLVLSASWRILLRQLTTQIYRRNENRMRVLIYGAGQTGQQLVAALRHDDAVVPVAFVDDNATLQSLVISGIRVHAPSSIKDIVASKNIDRIVLAMPSVNQSTQARIAYHLRDVGCEVHALPSFAEMVGEQNLKGKQSSLSMTDLLGRDRLEKELPGVSHAYSERRIMITGAGGSIGSELCRQVAGSNPACLVIVDHSELALYNIQKDLKALHPELKVVPVLGSVTDEPHMRDVMTDHQIEVVLHAAAYKHLPMVECNVIAGLRNNVIGTKALADAARDVGVERFILVSTDKAVRPTNVMGASKRLAELVIQDLATRSAGTRFAMVRFGNVLGSSGSVIPLFEEQIAHGGPVTLTHKDVTRYFMTIQEASRLVLLAGSFARGGDVFVLDMGKPVPIERLARQMIEGAGYSVKDAEHPEGDIEIITTGLRRGEKLHEELLISHDMLTTPHAKILRTQENLLSEFEIATALKEIRAAITNLDETAARESIARWVEKDEAEDELTADLMG